MLYMGCWLNKYEQATTLPSKICVLHHAHRIPSAIGHASSKITAWLKVHRWPRGSCLEFLALRARSTPHWATRELVATGEMHRIGRLGNLGLIWSVCNWSNNYKWATGAVIASVQSNIDAAVRSSTTLINKSNLLPWYNKFIMMLPGQKKVKLHDI